MRLLLATFSHETNTFSPVPTNIERFCRDGTALLSGQAAIEFYRGTGTCMGGFLAVADKIGAEIVVAVCASAPPSSMSALGPPNLDPSPAASSTPATVVRTPLSVRGSAPWRCGAGRDEPQAEP